MTNRVKDKLAAAGPRDDDHRSVRDLGRTGGDARPLRVRWRFLDCEHRRASWKKWSTWSARPSSPDTRPWCASQDHEAATITRALDRGAGGIQVPHVNTAAEAAAIVEHAKYAPLGHRGWSGWRGAYGVDASDYARQANDSTLVVIMLEEVEALNNLDDTSARTSRRLLLSRSGHGTGSVHGTAGPQANLICQCIMCYRRRTRCATSRAPAACQARSRRRERWTTTRARRAVPVRGIAVDTGTCQPRLHPAGYTRPLSRSA